MMSSRTERASIVGSSSHFSARAAEPLPYAEYRAKLRKRYDWSNPLRLVLMLAASIFIIELCIMYSLHYYSPLDFLAEEYLDATLLLMLLMPTIYYFHYRPIRLHEDRQIEMLNQLLSSEERLQMALVATNDGVWDWDLHNAKTWVSFQFHKMLGYPEDALKLDAMAWIALVHPEDHREVKNQLDKHLAGENEDFRAEYRLQCEDGSYLWVLGRGCVVERNPMGAPLRMVGTHSDISFRKRAEETLMANKERIRSLSHQLINSAEEEKRHLSRDLHDEFGQVITAVQMGLEMLQVQKSQDEDVFQFHCQRLLGLVRRMEVNVRQICDQLRPVMLDTLGLQPALERLVREVGEQKPDMKIDLAMEKLSSSLPDEFGLALFRICQESLNNIVKYARASRVQIHFLSADETVRLVIEDDGCGFDLGASPERDSRWGLGLLGMQERAEGLEGVCSVNSAPGEGTRVEVRLPLALQEGTCQSSVS